MRPGTDPEVLLRIEAYYDAAPRAAASAEDHGPLTLFVNRRPGWHYYARPRLGAAGPVQPGDVAAVRERQRALSVPESFEWVAEVTPSLRAAVERAGLEVHEHPLMVLDLAAFEAAAPGPPAGVDVRLVDPEAPDLATLRAVADLGFGSPGTRVGPVGPESLAAVAEHVHAAGVAALRERLRSGLTVMAAAAGREGPLAVGSHQPAGEVTEVVGVATLPAARRRGLATAVTHALVSDAVRRGCGIVFLSADDDAVARLYARIGFRRAATALIADPPVPPIV